MAAVRLCALVLSCLCVSGCATTQPVPAFDRGHLAEPGMAWEPDTRSAKLRGHVHTSKEASSGAAGAAGGGCGCN
ncbi:MAG: arginine decarboxylase [Halieaceae bacterium]|nr:arginine decarboxylase [Halieaceae bacterium]